MYHSLKLFSALIVTTNAIKLPVLLEDDAGEKEAIVLLMKSMSDECRFQRLMALAKTASTDKRKRDVWFLHDANFAPTDQAQVEQLKKAGVKIAAQPQPPASLVHFGDPSSGHTKPSFLEFAKEHPEYDYFWLMEDDVFFTGKWGEFFDMPLEKGTSSTDLIGAYRVRSKPWVWWKHSWTGNASQTKRAPCLIDGKECLEVNEVGQSVSLQFFWPVSRISKKFLTELRATLDTGKTKGHHEAVVANFCKKSDWCTMSQLPATGAYVANQNKENTALTLEYVADKYPPHKLQTSHVYHPVKCEAGGAEMGTQALCYAKLSSTFEESDIHGQC